MNPFRLFPRRQSKRVVFVLGCQRSGTTMLEKLLGRHDGVTVYGEGDRRAMRVEAFYRFREEDAIRKLIACARTPLVVFKPLNDSQHADRLRELHSDTKMIWIYRHYSDTINSMIRKWGENQKRIVHWIRDHASGERLRSWDGENWESIFAERVSPESLRMVRELAGDDISYEDGAGLVWTLRNQIYFDLRLDQDPDVLLVKYEDLVSSPEAGLAGIFRFIGLDGHGDYVGEIAASSVGKEPPPVLAPRIEELCRGMLERLDEAMTAGIAGSAAG